MADDVTVDNGAGTDYVVDTTALSGGEHVQSVQLVTAVAAGSKANLAKAEDAAHTSGDEGLMALAVRKDTAAALAGTDGDYTPLIVDSTGHLHVAVGSLPASDRTTDNVGAVQVTDAIMNDTTALTPKFKSATVAVSQTDSSLVAAVTSKKIRVLSLAVQCGSTATDVTFESDEATDVRLHKVPAGANGGQILPFNPVGWFETASGSALIVTTGAGSSVEISLTYIEV